MGKQKIIYLLLLLPILFLVILNFLLVFTPELGFDALWYHLTLPKLWLMKREWYFPGGLLYYSVMPRLAETLFIPLIHFTGTIGPKAIQYFSGIGTVLIMWKILTMFKVSDILKWSAVSLFYCTWLVSWQSGSAYVDLIRTFLEVTALFFLLKGSWKWGGILLGLAVGTKWLALVSLAVYGLVFGLHIVFPALLVALPWFAVAYFYTGNPVYPIFSGILDNSLLSIPTILKNLFLSPVIITKPFDDFISPMAGIVFILCLLSLKNKDQKIRKVAIIGIFGSLISLTLDPPSSRFLLPFFPALVISAVGYIGTLSEKIKKIFVYAVILSSIFVLSLRIYAFKKYLPFLTGRQSQTEFLVANSPRLPGTFIDADGFVAGLPQDSRILVDKLHNLYYFPRDFDHTSWMSDRSGYEYLVTIGEEGSASGNLIHQNQLGIQVFKLK